MVVVIIIVKEEVEEGFFIIRKQEVESYPIITLSYVWITITIITIIKE